MDSALLSLSHTHSLLSVECCVLLMPFALILYPLKLCLLETLLSSFHYVDYSWIRIHMKNNNNILQFLCLFLHFLMADIQTYIFSIDFHSDIVIIIIIMDCDQAQAAARENIHVYSVLCFWIVPTTKNKILIRNYLISLGIFCIFYSVYIHHIHC